MSKKLRMPLYIRINRIIMEFKLQKHDEVKEKSNEELIES